MQNTTITMEHTPETIKRLSKVQYDTFHYKAKSLWYTVFFLCILAGTGMVGTVSSNLQLILLAIGGIGIMNVGASARGRTSETLALIEANGGVFPCITFTITEKKITVQEDPNGKPYRLDKKNVIRLVDDAEYFYIFISRVSAHMLPKNQVDDLKSFTNTLCLATGQTTRSRLKLGQLNLSHISKWLRK